MGDARRPTPPLAADDGDDPAERRRRSSRCKVAERAAMKSITPNGCDQIFAHAARHQLAIEGDVVHAADDDHLGSGVAEFRPKLRAARAFRRARRCFRSRSHWGSAKCDRPRPRPDAPPMLTLTWAFSMRRSFAASLIVAASSAVSQNAWREMRGNGAIDAACGAVAEGSKPSLVMAQFPDPLPPDDPPPLDNPLILVFCVFQLVPGSLPLRTASMARPRMVELGGSTAPGPTRSRGSAT